MFWYHQYKRSMNWLFSKTIQYEKESPIFLLSLLLLFLIIFVNELLALPPKCVSKSVLLAIGVFAYGT